MTQRANYFVVAEDAIEILMEQESYLRKQFSNSDLLSVKIWELMKLRVSQINQCAFCIDMHSKDLLRAGETAERIIALSAWRDMPLFSDTERTVLNFAEQLSQGEIIDDALYISVAERLGEHNMVDLTIAINAINSWNRIVKTFKPEVGSYKR